MDEFFFPTNGFSLLESCQLYITEQYNDNNCCEIEAVIQRGFVKKLSEKSCKIHRKTHVTESLF